MAFNEHEDLKYIIAYFFTPNLGFLFIFQKRCGFYFSALREAFCVILICEELVSKTLDIVIPWPWANAFLNV